ncbi:MAG: hypothetical protein Kow0099_25960 [Candidatus Abyssubacteria bacterium]
MLSFMNMKCPTCESVYTLSIEELSVAVLFKCFECGQHNLYIAGHVLSLDPEIMTDGTEDEKIDHIVDKVETFGSEFAEDAFSKVERMVNVNVEVEMEKDGHPKKKRKKKKAGRRERTLQPSVRRANAPAISPEEIRDFLNIDLNLIDKKWFFDKHFGGLQN